MFLINAEIKDYFNILCEEFPLWLNDYINTSELQRIDKISISCGTDYCGLYNPPYFYSNLTHSIGVALIIWNFTKDKKATLAGLFHDIATPVFKHCIDFLNGDYENQESTEEKTFDIINNSIEIKKLLKRDNIKVEEVFDYKIYPIADNASPMLSADRLEYTFSSGLVFKRVWDLDSIKKIYSNLVVSKNEFGNDEIVFKDLSICEEYIDIIRELWPAWIDDADRTTMQFLADISKSMINLSYITVDDLYTMTESEVMDIIRNCDNELIREAFSNFENIDCVYSCDDEIEGKYCVYTKSKLRFINPYVLGKGRVYDLSIKARDKIESYKLLKNKGYTYFDFEFKVIN